MKHEAGLPSWRCQRACRPAPAAALLAIALFAALAPRAACQAPALEEEVAVMRQLRASVLRAIDGSIPLGGWAGWGSNHSVPHCSWEGVQCGERGLVTSLQVMPRTYKGELARPGNTDWAKAHRVAGPDAVAGPTPAPLLPGLVKLRRLEILRFDVPLRRPIRGIPAAWCLPGAFPSLKTLAISTALAQPADSLPELQPGALPRLDLLSLSLVGLRSTLPASWSAALPALSVMSLLLNVRGPLPPEWAHGFPNLVWLDISGLDVCREILGSFKTSCPAAVPAGWEAAGRDAEPAPPPEPGAQTAAVGWALEQREGRADEPPKPPLQLPPQWAQGFPRLAALTLSGLGLSGTIPDAWQNGSFTMLGELVLTHNKLTGTLPRRLFSNPTLYMLSLENNSFSGPLPPEWAQASVRDLKLSHNLLTGPAFPPAWLEQHGLHDMAGLWLAGNRALTGTLPPTFPYPNLEDLSLAGTGVTGSIPEGWCTANHSAFLYISLNDTALSPVLPPACVGMKRLTFYGLPPRGRLGTVQRSAIALASLGAALGLAGLATAGLARWQRRRRAARPLPDGLPLLAGRGHGSTAAQDNSVGDGAKAGAGLTRRQRLSSALQRATRGGTRGIGMLPPQALSAAFAHQMQLRRDSTDSRATPRSGTATGQGLEPVPERQAAASSAAHAAATAGGADGIELGPSTRWRTDSVVATGNDGAGPEEELERRRWGLGTTSLKLEPGELRLVTDRLGRLVELGQGASAVVYLGRLSGTQVAVKALELEPWMESGGMWSEVARMRLCLHPHIVPLYGVALQDQTLLLAMRLMQGGTLRAALLDPARRKALAWRSGGRRVALQVADALHFLHTELRMLHSDMSSKNVLLDEQLGAAVSDLGVARVLSSAARTAAGFTLTHAAPEQLLGQRCTLAADVYGFGVLLAELATGEVVLRRGGWRLPAVPQQCPQAVLALIQDCTAAEPERRPTAAQALERLQAASAE